MNNKELMTIAQVAKMLGISRIAVYKKVKNGQIKAIRVGRSYVIPAQDLAEILGRSLTEERKQQIDMAVAKTVKEYSETLRLLGRE